MITCEIQPVQPHHLRRAAGHALSQEEYTHTMGILIDGLHPFHANKNFAGGSFTYLLGRHSLGEVLKESSLWCGAVGDMFSLWVLVHHSP